jgi:hypothetical protein
VSEVSFCKGTNRIGVSLFSSEDGNRSSFPHIMFSRYLELWTMDKVHKLTDSACYTNIVRTLSILPSLHSERPCQRLIPLEILDSFLSHYHNSYFLMQRIHESKNVIDYGKGFHIQRLFELDIYNDDKTIPGYRHKQTNGPLFRPQYPRFSVDMLTCLTAHSMVYFVFGAKSHFTLLVLVVFITQIPLQFA